MVYGLNFMVHLVLELVPKSMQETKHGCKLHTRSPTGSVRLIRNTLGLKRRVARIGSARPPVATTLCLYGTSMTKQDSQYIATPQRMIGDKTSSSKFELDSCMIQNIGVIYHILS